MFPSIREAADPFKFYARMRHELPVCFDENVGCWGVFRYRDVRQVATDDETFSRKPSHYVASKSSDNLITRSLHYEDPPEHTLSRELLMSVLSAKEQRRYEPLVARIINETLDEMFRHKQFDIVSQASEPITVRTIAAFLGIPESRHNDLKHWLDAVTMVDVTSPNWLDSYVAQELVFEEISRYFLNLADERTKNPGDDFVSHLLSSRVGERAFSVESVAGNCTLLVLAMDVIKLFLGNMVYVILRHPHVLEALKQSSNLVPSVVEECFRFLGPTHAISRVVTRDVEMSGHLIKAGQMVYAWLASANHDESIFAAADTFNEDRDDISSSLAFSGGAHFCPGGPFIRMIANNFLLGFASRAGKLLITTETLERLPNYIFFGFKEIGVTNKN